MARTTISIPDDLKKRMDRAKEPINWSAVAAEAFELKLGELAKRQKEQTMESVIDRLRASKIENGSAEFQDGRAIGKAWAEKRAEYAELRRLSDLDADEFFDNSPWDEAPAGALVDEITGTDNSRDEALEFWQPIVGDDTQADERLASFEFLKGFVEGATEVFSNVSDKL